MSSVILFILYLIFVFCFWILMRNTRVYKFRGHILDLLHQKNVEDINAGKDWLWRFEIWSSVSYGAMVFGFWRSYESFYPKDFLEDIGYGK